jgi:hypothetical protein
MIIEYHQFMTGSALDSLVGGIPRKHEAVEVGGATALT